jgi:hypothetical protein
MNTTETSEQSLYTALKMGIILGVVYCVLIFIQNRFFYGNPIQFGLVKIICYIVILSGFFYTGYLYKKQSGGYITFQECLKAMLLAIAITELFYIFFGIIYIKFIDPSFIAKMKLGLMNYLRKLKVPEEKISEQMEKFNDAGKITFWISVQSYGFALIIDAVFAVIFAAILRKQRPASENYL